MKLQDFNAKLSDFGLAKDGPMGDQTHVSTRVMGTYGYAAPEYVMTGKSSDGKFQLMTFCVLVFSYCRLLVSKVLLLIIASHKTMMKEEGCIKTVRSFNLADPG